MPDFTMCTSRTCPKTRQCERHPDSGTAPKPFWQSYGGYAPDEHGVCRGFVEVGGK